METPRMEPDGRTRIAYVPDTAAKLRATAEILKQFGEDMSKLGLQMSTLPPSNERPWHKHTLPSRRRR